MKARGLIRVIMADRVRLLVALFTVPLMVFGIILTFDVQGPSFSAPDWGYTLFSLGADLAVVYLIIDFLLLREERQLWKVVEGKAIGLIQSELKVVLLVVFHLLLPPIDVDSSKEETMLRMKELAADLAKVRSAIVPFSADLSSVFDQLARDFGDLQLRYSPRLKPELVDIIIDIETALGSISATLPIVKILSEDEVKDEVCGAFFILIRALVKAVDGGFVELPYKLDFAPNATCGIQRHFAEVRRGRLLLALRLHDSFFRRFRVVQYVLVFCTRCVATTKQKTYGVPI